VCAWEIRGQHHYCPVRLLWSADKFSIEYGFSRFGGVHDLKEAIRFCDALGVERPGGGGKPQIFHYGTLQSSNRSLWKRRSLLCHPERSRGICSSADLSWKYFSTALRSQLSSREPVTFPIFSCFLHIQPSVFQAPRQSRHPERSASQIYRKQKASWRGVEGPRRCLLADALGSFPAAYSNGR
jgi:hypothetical protein